MTELLENIEFTVPVNMVCAIMYGDGSGLSDSEIEAVDALEERAESLRDAFEGTHYHWSTSEGVSSEFCHTNDVDGVAGDCVVINLVIMRSV